MPTLKLYKPKKEKNQPDNKEKTSKGKKVARAGKPRGKMPVKKSINLVIKPDSAVSMSRLGPVIAILVIVVLLFGKFMVVDKILAAVNATNEVADLQSKLQGVYATIATYDEVADDYAHYTYSGMTEEELGLVDRVKVMKLLERVLGTGDTTKSWNLTGNILKLRVNGTSLRELNEVSRLLEQDPIVDQCIISTANKSKQQQQDLSDVAADFIIYLKKPETEQTGQTGQSSSNQNQQGGQGNILKEQADNLENLGESFNGSKQVEQQLEEVGN